MRRVAYFFLLLWICVLTPISHAPAKFAPQDGENASRENPSSAEHVWKATSLNQADRGQLLERYGQLPLFFESNQGQADRQVKFLSHGNGYSLFITSDGAVLALGRIPAQSLTRTGEKGSSGGSTAVLRMQLVGANPRAQAEGLEELPGKSNYFIGNDARKWRTNVPQYVRVLRRNVYPGIDLLYHGNQRQLEMDFILAPGANPKVIRMDFYGAERLTIDPQGDLVLRTGAGDLRLYKPRVYQEAQGLRQEVSSAYVLKGVRTVGFEVAEYDVTRPLVIDPVVSYATYSGFLGSIAVDASGNAYVAGGAGVVKFNASGSAVVYSTVLGGTVGARTGNIAVDNSGNAYVTGFTSIGGFPTTPGAFQTTVPPGKSATNNSAFVFKLNPTGTLVYSTLVTGSGDDQAKDIAVDASGNAYVTGFTASSDFPVANPIQAGIGGGLTANYDAFVTKINATGSALIYSTYLGGANSDGGNGIAVDISGNAYVTGNTSSSDFPTANAFQPNLHGGSDAFVTKFNATGSALIYSTYLGGSSDDSGGLIAVDTSGNAYVEGFTVSNDFPKVSPFLDGGNMAALDGIPFLTVLNPLGSALVYSSGLEGQFVTGMGVDSSGNAYVAGKTTTGGAFSPNIPFPTTVGAFNTIFDPNVGSFFLAKIENRSAAGFGFTAGSLNLGNVPVNTTSGPLLVSLRDIGSLPLGITSIAVTGDFTQINNCGSSLPAAGSCLVTITFTPTTTGPRTGTITVADDASGSPHVLNLSGTGTTPVVALSPASLTFGSQAVGITSAPQALTLTNSGTSDLTVSRIDITGDFRQSNSCSPSIPPGANCALNVTFSPSATGTRTGALTITDNAAGSPHVVSLTGTGIVDFGLSASPGTATVRAGQGANYMITITPQGGSFDNAVVLSCSGLPLLASCTFTPNSVVPGASRVTLNLSVSTTASSAVYAPPVRPQPQAPLYALCLGVLGVVLMGTQLLELRYPKKGLKFGLVVAPLLILLFFETACGGGGGSTSQPLPRPGTTPGTYTITIVGTSGSLQHSTTATLGVQ